MQRDSNCKCFCWQWDCKNISGLDSMSLCVVKVPLSHSPAPSKLLGSSSNNAPPISRHRSRL
ncbi:protein of unknown function [Candidatus Promineifilum breve]|uniref:Uncharacterized protein n=1 Tax=Candidatus Promineifilum breve TaxID=1806508 RepID=A0A160T556_9CHLR|nr:protein of unknown function [Candidatus Promineifilum breve]